MTPCTATEQVLHSRFGHAEALGNASVRSFSGIVSAPDFKHVSRREPGVSVSFAARDEFWLMPRVVSATVHHVTRVLQGRPNLEMFRVAAWRVVALVANRHAFRNGSVGQFESNSVSAPVFSQRRYVDLSVTAPVPAARPLTAARFGLSSEAGQEATGKGPNPIGQPKGIDTEAGAKSVCFTGESHKRLSAIGARFVYQAGLAASTRQETTLGAEVFGLRSRAHICGGSTKGGAALGTSQINAASLGAHREDSFRGAKPSVATNYAGALRSLFYRADAERVR